jgi:carbonic anhydrase
MLTFKDADLQEKLKKELHCSADHIAFLAFGNLEDSVREDVNFLKSDPFVLKNIPITGFIYDVKTGKLNQVV